MGLELQPSQTRLTHTLHVEAGGAGFDLLGFNIRQDPTKAKRGYKTIITPSRQAGERIHFTPRGGGARLAFHTERPIRRHVKVQARRSPYDGDEVYWSTRQGQYPGVSTRVSTLLKRQAGKCRYCGYYCKIGAVLEVDHIIPRAAGGRDAYT